MRDNPRMKPRRRRHHVVNVNWVQIAVQACTPITVEEARRIAIRAYLAGPERRTLHTVPARNAP